MQQLKSIRRLLLGGALAGAALGGAPALAGAQGIPDSTCVYHDDTHVVTVSDQSGPLQLRLLVDQLDIGVQNPFGNIVRCHSLDGTITATILNTDSINVSGTLVGIADGYVIDEQHGGALTPGFTKEADGFSEIEVNFATRGVPTALDIQGTDTTASGITDTIRFGRIPGALNGVNYGPDNDVDYKIQAGATRFTASGNGGNDIISATGNPDRSTLAPTTVPVTFSGGDGDDVLAGGQDVDSLVGGSGNDFFLSDGDGQVDRLVGQRTVVVRLYDGSKSVGMVNIRPGDGHVTADGSIARGARVSHRGRTVSARLALRLPRSLAGRFLRVAVEATDRHGHKQLEPDAGDIHVVTR